MKDGAIPNYAKAGTPRISLAEARQLREAGTDPRRRPLTGPGGSTPSNGTLLEHRASHEQAKAQKAQIELSTLLGQTLDRQDVEDALFQAGREMRNAMTRRWRVLAVELEGLSAREIEAKGEAADTKLLGDLVRRFKSMTGN